jgi:hypothetical protein
MDCGALCRPGPLHNGAAREYGEIKQGGKLADSASPGARRPPRADAAPDRLPGADPGHRARRRRVSTQRGVGEIRTIIAKKEGEQAFERERERFIEGARTLHERTDYPPMSEDLAEHDRSATGDVGRVRLQRCSLRRLRADQLLHRVPEGVRAGRVLRLGARESIKDKDRTRQLLRDAAVVRSSIAPRSRTRIWPSGRC